MKMQELYAGMSVMLTNEENNFVILHGYDVPVTSLNEREELIANSLIKKGVYDISSDRKYLTKPQHAKK